MSDFWAGYLLGRGSSDDSIPPGLAILFAAFLGFIVLLFVFQRIFEAIASIMHSHPVLVLLVVGTVTAGLSELVGMSRNLDVETKLLTPGILAAGAFVVFWIVGELAGVSSFDQTPLVLQLPMLGLSLVIVGGFMYMLVGIIKYRCRTRHGRILRAATFVCVSWWAWASVFSIPFPTVPVLGVDIFLGVGVTAALTTGFVELQGPSESTTKHDLGRDG
jgi:hypothetical protein